MLTAVRSSVFKRDVKRLKKRGKDMEKLSRLLVLLIEQKPVLHIEPDWLLIYRVVGNELQLARTGSHSDLFEE
jgi:mRNA interferase YafQ